MNPQLKKRPKKITQAMIARECGVSQTLVSIVLSGSSDPDRIAESTRRRILEAAQCLGYQFRNGGARKNTLALILPAIQRTEKLGSFIYDGIEEFYARTQRFVTEAACRHGYALIARPYESGTELTHWLAEWSVDGVLWHAKDLQLHKWITQRYPTSQLHFSSLPNTDAATVNREELIMLGGDYLRERGHHRIVFTPGSAEPGCKMHRICCETFHEMMVRHGFSEEDANRLCVEGQGTHESVVRCMDLMRLPKEKRPTAFIGGDPLILELARTLQQQGFGIPEDVSLLGIDNISATSFYNPRISSIDVCQQEVSEAAVEMVVNRIADPTRRYQKIYISPKIIERESVRMLSPSRVVENAFTR